MSEMRPQFRAWTFDEVPVGALIRQVDNGGVYVLWMSTICAKSRARNSVGWSIYVVSPGERSELLVDKMHTFDLISHSVDSGNTWRRCGVEIQTAPPCQSP